MSARTQYLIARLLSRLPERLLIWLSGQPARIVDDQRFDPHAQLLRKMRRNRPRPGLIQPSVDKGRQRYRRDANNFRGPVTTVRNVRTFEIPGEEESLRVRHYTPYAPAARDLTIYLHGGGFVIGELDTHDEPCRILSRYADVHVLSIEYRLAPEHKFPAALNDVLAALSWAGENAASLGADPTRISIGGDSAGGNLAAVASRIATRAGTAPFAQLLIYPVADSVTKRRSHELFGQEEFLTIDDCRDFGRAYTGGTNVSGQDPRVSPLLAPDLADLPPALVVTAGFDLLRDEGEAYADALLAAGNLVHAQRMAAFGHGFIHLTGVSRTARRAMITIATEWRTLLDAAEEQRS